MSKINQIGFTSQSNSQVTSTQQAKTQELLFDYSAQKANNNYSEVDTDKKKVTNNSDGTTTYSYDYDGDGNIDMEVIRDKNGNVIANVEKETNVKTGEVTTRTFDYIQKQ